MSYVRPARADEVKEWLLNTGFISDETQAEKLAEALVEFFDMLMESKTQ